MVCRKDQIYNWFKTLDGAKRIDFLNGLLHLCFPLELRFIGSCIEELARKDYNYLRDAEIKANTVQEVLTMQDISDKVTRSKMIVTLALLTSTNQECARLLYDTLKIDIVNILNGTKALDDIIADEYLLLLTMASNHPAFDFLMKTIMNEQLKRAEFKLKTDNILKRDSFNDFCFYNSEHNNNNNNDTITNNTIVNETTYNNNTSQSFKAKNTKKNVNKVVNSDPDDEDDDDDDGDDEGDDNADEYHHHHEKKNDNDRDSGKDDNDDADKPGDKHIEVTNGNDTDILDDDNDEQFVPVQKPFVKSVNFEGVKNIRGTENYKFLIKIHWSDNKVSKIGKTFLEIYEFHKQLIKNYANDLCDFLKDDELEFNANKKEDFVKELPIITQYCSKIGNLPEKISQSEFVTEFFKNNEYDECEEIGTTPPPVMTSSVVSVTCSTSPMASNENLSEISRQQTTSAKNVNQVKSMSPINRQLDTIKTNTEDSQASDSVDKTIGPDQLDKKPIAIVQKERRQLHRSSFSSPCPSPILHVGTANNPNSRSNSPAAAQQRLNLRQYGAQSPLFVNQLAAHVNIMQQQPSPMSLHYQHQAQLATTPSNMHKSTLIPMSQSKSRNQNDDALSRSVDSQGCNDNGLHLMADRHRLSNQQLPMAPPSSLSSRSYHNHHDQQHASNAAQQFYATLSKQDHHHLQQHIQQMQPPPPSAYAMPYPINAYQIPNLLSAFPDMQQMRFPTAPDAAKQPQQPQLQPLLQPNFMVPPPPPLQQQQATRLPFANGVTDMSSTDSTSPPTSQSPALVQQQPQQQQQQQHPSSFTNKNIGKMAIVQSDDDRPGLLMSLTDQKYRKSTKAGTQLSKQVSMGSQPPDKQRNQLPFHYQQLHYATPQQYIAGYATTMQPTPQMIPHMYYTDRPVYPNTPPPPPSLSSINGPSSMSQPIGINVNTSFNTDRITTPPISGADMPPPPQVQHNNKSCTKQQHQNQQQQLIFPISPSPQQINPIATKAKDQSQAKQQQFNDQQHHVKSQLAKHQSTATNNSKPTNKNLIHNDSTQSLPEISNLIQSQSSRATPSPNNYNHDVAKPQTYAPAPASYTLMNSPNPNNSTSLCGFVTATSKPSSGNSQQYMESESLGNGLILQNGLPLAQAPDGTASAPFIPFQQPIYLIPMMTTPNGLTQQNPSQMAPPGVFYANQSIQQGFAHSSQAQTQQQATASSTGSSHTPRTTTTTVATAATTATTANLNDFQNISGTSVPNKQQMQQMPTQVNFDSNPFFDNLNIYQINQLMALTNQNFINANANRNFLQQQMPTQPPHQMHAKTGFNSFGQRKKSCANCGSKTHMANECKEPTLENMTQTAGFRLSFKPITNGSSGSNNNLIDANKNNNNNNSVIDMNKLKNTHQPSDTNPMKTATGQSSELNHQLNKAQAVISPSEDK